MSETDDATRLARKFAEISRSLADSPSVERTMQEIVESATEVVDGAVSAGITVVRRDGTIETPAFTDDLVLEVDRAQLESGQGPCLEAGAEGELVKIEDMATELRWPDFAQRAESLGIGSMIACGLPAQRGTRAALNLHAPKPDAFDETALQTASICAVHSSAALARVTLVDSLRTAVASRQGIGEATGILMERHRVDSAQAFEMLVRASQSLNVKLRVIAEHVAHTGQDPAAITLADLAPLL
ncbi:MAG TPA: GAF and ANTAR domain-containing protein [Actinocrinis sp.]|nr:GAF and ANTAR domain-containing protein [Actinocrinis sp.]